MKDPMQEAPSAVPDGVYLPEMNDADVSSAISSAASALETVARKWKSVRMQLGKEIFSLRQEVKSLRDQRHLLAEQARKNVLDNTPTANVEDRGGAFAVALDVAKERARQEAKWGQQHHPTGCETTLQRSDTETRLRAICEGKTSDGNLTWIDILNEEVAELHNSGSFQDAYDEAIQVAAVASAMAESIRRKLRRVGG